MFVLGADESFALDSGHILWVSAADVAASGHRHVTGDMASESLIMISDMANESLVTTSDTSSELTDYH